MGAIGKSNGSCAEEHEKDEKSFQLLGVMCM
jgi:hypothetical protein